MFYSIIDVDIPDDLQMDVSNIERKRKMTAMEDDDRIISVSEEQRQSYHIVNVHEWLNGTWKDDDDDDNQILPIVDLRSYEDFDRQHIDMTSYANSGNNKHTVPTIVNLPLQTLLSGERSCELPPRHVEFAILIPRQYTQQFLERSDDCAIHQLFFASMSKSTLQSRKPWLVRQILIDSDILWKDAIELNIVKSYNRESVTSFQRLPRLWKPDPITTNILPILKEWTINLHDQNRIGLVLDLGSGAGRDVCYIAEELKEYQNTQQSSKSIHVVGIDNHKGSAKRCIPLWKNRSVDDITHSLLLDLNKLHQVRSTFMDSSKLFLKPMQQKSEIICLYAIRFLNRKLLSYIANSTINNTQKDSIESESTSKSAIHSPPQPLMLPTGTIFAMSHFCKPKDGATWDFDHPKESSVLERSELKNLFETRGWQVLRDDIILDGDHGRTLIQFIAKKVA